MSGRSSHHRAPVWSSAQAVRIWHLKERLPVLMTFQFRLRWRLKSFWFRQRHCNGWCRLKCVNKLLMAMALTAQITEPLVEQLLIVHCFVYQLKRFVLLRAKMMTNWLGKTMDGCVSVSGSCDCEPLRHTRTVSSLKLITFSQGVFGLKEPVLDNCCSFSLLTTS